MTQRFETDEVIGGWLRRLAIYQFLVDVYAGRSVLELGCGDGVGARFLADQGAARVVGVDTSAEAIQRASARHRLTNLEFRCGEPGALELEDGAFDVIAVAGGLEVLRRRRVLEELRRVLRRDGVLVLAAPSSDRPRAGEGASYFELVDRLEPAFAPVRMVALAPFVGMSLVGYGDTDDPTAVELDTSLLDVLDRPDDEVTDYVAVCGPVGLPEDFALVQVPASAGLAAVARALGVAREPATPAESAYEIAAEALSRVRDLQAQIAAGSSPARAEDPELRRRLVRAVEERDAAQERVRALKEQLDDAQLEIGRVVGQAGIEVNKARQGTHELRERVDELEDQLARAGAPAVAAGPPASASDARAVSPDAGPVPDSPTVTELIARAMSAHYVEVERLEQVLEETGAFADELAAERDAVAAELEAARSELAARDRELGERSRELREMRSRAAQAEGALLRRDHAASAAVEDAVERAIGEQHRAWHREVAAARTARAELERALDEVRAELASVNAELEAAVADRARAQHDIDARQQRLERLEAEVGVEVARRERGSPEAGPSGGPTSGDASAVRADAARDEAAWAASQLCVLNARLHAIASALAEDLGVLESIDRAVADVRRVALSPGPGDLSPDAERARRLAAELGSRDAELNVLQLGADALRARLREVIAQVQCARDDMAGRSAIEMLERMQALAERLEAYPA
jgi:SAM-dependent methyltransferase/peptidoglycan hydrolase CwlO-like protein